MFTHRMSGHASFVGAQQTRREQQQRKQNQQRTQGASFKSVPNYRGERLRGRKYAFPKFGGGSWCGFLFQIIFVVIIIVISTWLGIQIFIGGSKKYSLIKRDKYVHARITSTIGKEIEYFVPRGFAENHKSKDRSNKRLYKLEKQIEGEYASVLSKQCIYERDRHTRSLNVARRAKNKSQIKYLEEKILASCDKFNLLFAGDGQYRDLVPPVAPSSSSLL